MHPLFPKTRFVVAALFSVLTLAVPAAAQSDASRASTNGSEALSRATGSIVAGTASLIVVGSILVVDAIETAGESVVVVLKGVGQGVSEASTVSVKVAASVVGNASLAIGSSVKVVAEASGHALYLSGKLIAFIPNEIGKSLVHHSPVKKTAGGL